MHSKFLKDKRAELLTAGFNLLLKIALLLEGRRCKINFLKRFQGKSGNSRSLSLMSTGQITRNFDKKQNQETPGYI